MVILIREKACCICDQNNHHQSEDLIVPHDTFDGLFFYHNSSLNKNLPFSFKIHFVLQNEEIHVILYESHQLALQV